MCELCPFADTVKFWDQAKGSNLSHSQTGLLAHACACGNGAFNECQTPGDEPVESGSFRDAAAPRARARASRLGSAKRSGAAVAGGSEIAGERLRRAAFGVGSRSSLPTLVRFRTDGGNCAP